MSRPNVTDEIVTDLAFARACVLDQQEASHARKDYSWDDRYAGALAALDLIVRGHDRSKKNAR